MGWNKSVCFEERQESIWDSLSQIEYGSWGSDCRVVEERPKAVKLLDNDGNWSWWPKSWLEQDLEFLDVFYVRDWVVKAGILSRYQLFLLTCE